MIILALRHPSWPQMRDEPHRPTHRNHQHVSESQLKIAEYIWFQFCLRQIRHRSDDARQRSQDPKDIHGLHQTLLRGDSRRNRRPNQERQ